MAPGTQVRILARLLIKMQKRDLTTAIASITILTIIILFVSYFSLNNKIIGPVLVILGIITLIPIIFFKIPLAALKGDIIFGLIDNGALAIFAITGAEFFGILGAIVGGIIGNAITDGLAGIFEGYEWQMLKETKAKKERTALTVSIGKLAGCLLGAGIVLTLIWTF